MATTTDWIYWGEAYDISVTAQDAEGDAITMDGTYSAAVRITRDKIGGKEVFTQAMTIAAGVATITLDTRSAAWTHGVYYYDVRITDPDGYDQWTDPVELTLRNRNTFPSAS